MTEPLIRPRAGRLKILPAVCLHDGERVLHAHDWDEPREVVLRDVHVRGGWVHATEDPNHGRSHMWRTDVLVAVER